MKRQKFSDKLWEFWIIFQQPQHRNFALARSSFVQISKTFVGGVFGRRVALRLGKNRRSALRNVFHRPRESTYAIREPCTAGQASTAGYERPKESKFYEKPEKVKRPTGTNDAAQKLAGFGIHDRWGWRRRRGIPPNKKCCSQWPGVARWEITNRWVKLFTIIKKKTYFPLP